MINLVLYFSMIVGSYVPHNCQVWQYYKVLRQMLNVLLFKNITTEVVEYLNILICEHHELYMKLFNTHLKPKHHHLTHYRSAILKLGPLCHMWSMRFEGKNLENKFIAETSRSRVNICKSIAIRHMFYFSHNLYFMRKEGAVRNIEEVGPVIEQGKN